jgi:5-methylcytosine-specific restriction endonuclease McrA
MTKLSAEEIDRRVEEMVRQCKYEGYITSRRWYAKRKLKLIQMDFTCERCGYRSYDEDSIKKLDVHHKTYDHFGEEPLSDLIVLCRDCHQKEHGRVF